MQLPLRNILFYIILTALAAGLSSCRSALIKADFQALARASITLGVNIGPHDNHKLYLEAARWIGTPYRSGGSSTRGTDCTGLTSSIYRKVYNISLPRTTEEQKSMGVRVKKSNLKEGDLVFFSSDRKSRRVGHAGIYLKNHLFIHASSSRGVMISSLEEEYYRRHWMVGKRVLRK